MGDRVLFQVYSSKNNAISPVIYGHWSGSDAIEVVNRLRVRMKERGDDVPYAAARLVQELIGDEEGALGYGIWNAEGLLTAEDSHGDAGVVLIDSAKDYTITCLGGYLNERILASTG